MPIDASIPLQGKKPDTFGRLSELMQMQRQSIATQADKVALESATQSQKQRRELAGFDWAKLAGDDGTIDLNKIMGSGLREAAGDQFPQVMQQAVNLRQSQLAAKQTLIGLTNDQRSAFGSMVGALRSDPDVVNGTPEGKQKLNQALGQYITMYGPDVENVVKAYAAPLMNAPPGKAGQVLQNIQLQATSASDQASRQAPQYTSTGGSLQQTNPYAQSGQNPERIDLTIAPGQQSEVVTDQAGIPLEQRRDARGNIQGVRPLAGMPTYEPGEVQSLIKQADTNYERVASNRDAASLAPQQLDQIDKALRIAGEVSTGGGEWARTRAKFESAIASAIPGIDAVSNDATKLQLLDKYLERIAADSARVLGANASTDAARESIARQNASTGYTRDAVQNVLEYARAQTKAMAAKGDAQEKWFKDGGKITGQHEFETKWRQAYDPLLFQLESMPAERAKKKLDAEAPARRAELREKLKLMRDLGALK